MVTKHVALGNVNMMGSVLAKIHMVTKHNDIMNLTYDSSVLAKIHMVTKPQKYGSTFLNVIEY